MAENQLLDTFYQMMPKSFGNGQSCNNLATDLISLRHSISPPLILSPPFSSLSLILSLCSVNQTISGVLCLSLPVWPLLSLAHNMGSLLCSCRRVCCTMTSWWCRHLITSDPASKRNKGIQKASPFRRHFTYVAWNRWSWNWQINKVFKCKVVLFYFCPGS